MASASTAADRCIDRRSLLKAGVAFAAAGPAILRAGHAKAEARASRATALFAYVGAFTTPERKGHGGGINVYRVDPASGAWTHEQLLEVVNPSFLARASRSSTPPSWRSTGRSAFSIRCMPTWTRSAPMRSTGKAGM